LTSKSSPFGISPLTQQFNDKVKPSCTGLVQGCWSVDCIYFTPVPTGRTEHCQSVNCLCHTVTFFAHQHQLTYCVGCFCITQLNSDLQAMTDGLKITVISILIMKISAGNTKPTLKSRWAHSHVVRRNQPL